MARAMRSWVLACAGTGFALATQAAPNQVWGFVDAEGVARFSSVQVDPRYELFYSEPVAAPSGSAPLKSAAPAPSAATMPPALQASFEVSPAYKAVRHHIRAAASDSGLDYELLKAVIATESGFDARAVSPKGAVGLMQVMPATAQRFGVAPRGAQTVQQRLTDPRTNIQTGARYLAWLMQRFGGRMDLVLAAYNAGEGAVLRAGRKVPNYPETRNYVQRVTQLFHYLRPPRALDRIGPSPAGRQAQARLRPGAASAMARPQPLQAAAARPPSPAGTP